jgi:hypothetical protein
MPDAGDFERDNDARDAHMGWGEAFAALPQESPDAGGWQRVQARLPARDRPDSRTRRPLWLATAASLLLAVAIPLRMLPLAEQAAPVPMTPASATPDAVEPAAATPTVATPSVAIGAQPVPAVAARGDRQRRMPPSQRPIRTAVNPVDSTRIAAADANAGTDLEPLYAQSAQLEDLLAMARDERVASGTTAALSDELDARVAGIDAALIQPGLSDAQRADLWGRRVEALQQLVGIEATNRLYAARGQSYDAALVSID